MNDQLQNKAAEVFDKIIVIFNEARDEIQEHDQDFNFFGDILSNLVAQFVYLHIEEDKAVDFLDEFKGVILRVLKERNALMVKGTN